MKSKIVVVAALVVAFSTSLFAKQNTGQKKMPEKKTRASCAQTSAVIDLDINNVRATLMNGGDMWWDRAKATAAYEVPKGDGTGDKKNALFAGSIWIGGYDKGSGNLKVAAQTYRQGGNDYWSGPLDATASITNDECVAWDRFWKIDASAIDKFISIYSGLSDSLAIRNAILDADGEDLISKVIKEWPARGSNTAIGASGNPLTLSGSREYAPWVDRGNDDDVYDYLDGDYPRITGDQYIWWVFNDRGNSKTETGTPGIGLEIAAAAFAFQTSDELNDATFYNYRIVNKATSSLDSTFMSTWTDADLGYAYDDFVGCDVQRGLGILYNGDDFDEGPGGYGSDIPMIGIDYFRGPKAKTATGADTTLGMSSFMFYNNENTNIGNPLTGIHFYQYMQAIWRDSRPLTKACNGVNAAPATKFAYPLDQKECDCNNTPADRRFVHSSGPFTLDPGVVSDITIGAIFVPSIGGNCPSFGKLQSADDKAQALFENNFKLPFGPMAPDVIVRPYNQRITFYLNNPQGSNNYKEGYGRIDSNATEQSLESSSDALKQGAGADTLYKFEGYIVYQLRDQSVTLSQIRKKDGSIDEEKARIVMQSDIKNEITTLYNFENDPTLPNNNFYTPKLMVAGADKGIVNNFEITQDAFAKTSTKNLVNYKTYYYVVMAYAQNTFRDFEGSTPYLGQSTAYRESRTNGRKGPITVIKVIPTPTNDNMYVQNNSSYGDGVEITRLEGKGNGGNALELTEESINKIINDPEGWRTPTYKAGEGPITVKVTCPDSLKNGNYKLRMQVNARFNPNTRDSSLGAKGDSTFWVLERTINGVTETITAEKNIANYNEQLIAEFGENIADFKDWGLAIGMQQQIRPFDPNTDENIGFISAKVTIADPSKRWLTAIQDDEKVTPDNWIRSGDYFQNADEDGDYRSGGFSDLDVSAANNVQNFDEKGAYERILGGTWAPYQMCALTQRPSSANVQNVGCELQYVRFGSQERPSISNTNSPNAFAHKRIHSVDIVFTSDRSKWTKCCVIEMNSATRFPQSPGYVPAFSEGNAYQWNLRKHASLKRDPDAQGNPVYDATETGRSWFPGYAINIETGERLNIVFGEDSGDPQNNGRDMIWNPTDVSYSIGSGNTPSVNWGGHHVVYVSNTRYDAYDGGADFIYNQLKGIDKDEWQNDLDPSAVAKRRVYMSMSWVSPALLQRGARLLNWKDGLVPTETRVSIRVIRPYDKFASAQTPVNDNWPLYEFKLDKVAPSPLTDSKNIYANDDAALLDRLTVVPNPYYAYSEYENNRLDSRVKIINLPATATIKIYQPDGTLIRTLQKSDASSAFIDWDLKNQKGIPVSSGMYLMHVKIKTATGEKEKVLKWFGVMRPLDITSF
jgi:hypothetical protein